MYSMYPRLGICLGVLAFATGFGFGLTELAAAQESARPTAPDSTVEAQFLRENDAAMMKMMNDMAVRPTGDVDRNFALMMIPHHQGGIDMAIVELRHGKNEQLRRLAQKIIVEQMQEIAAMRLAIGAPLPPSSAAPTRQPDATQVEPPVPPMSRHHHNAQPAR